MIERNPIVETVFTALMESEEWKLNQLAEHVFKLHKLELDDNFEKQVFKKNFLIMNALFQLAIELPELGFHLEISGIHVKLWPREAGAIIRHHSQALAEYYLNWHHYETDENTIKSLIEQFWQAYFHSSIHIDKPSKAAFIEASQRMGLDGDADFQSLQKQWRKKALQLHPDRTHGDKTAFQQLHFDWQVIKRYFNEQLK